MEKNPNKIEENRDSNRIMMENLVYDDDPKKYYSTFWEEKDHNKI